MNLLEVAKLLVEPARLPEERSPKVIPSGHEARRHDAAQLVKPTHAIRADPSVPHHPPNAHDPAATANTSNIVAPVPIAHAGAVGSELVQSSSLATESTPVPALKAAHLRFTNVSNAH